jgi:hypothetical protein
LLVPETRLNAAFDEFAPDAEKLVPNFMQSGSLRDKFSEKVAPRFGVNAQVIASGWIVMPFGRRPSLCYLACRVEADLVAA